MNNEIKLHILGVAMNKLGNWLIRVMIIRLRMLKKKKTTTTIS